tara:strand:+ start:191 stop:445 length:255 start_codon:yes stop_codon:yes gene_type:complete
MGSNDSMSWYRAPKHEVLSAAQAKKELKALKLEEDRLPLILMSDKAITTLIDEGKTIVPGTIIKITRDSKTAGEAFLYYRKVVV